jgi:hypothetical protein
MNPIEVIISFYQSGENDCTTIATIKTAIAAYGINNVFANAVPGTDNIWSVTLRDGTIITIADADINILKSRSGFKLNNESGGVNAEAIYNYALFCFGIFVANFARMNRVSIEVASHMIDDGINVFQDRVTPYASYRYLGFEDTYITMLTDDNGITDASVISTNPVYLLCNVFHAVLATGAQYDEYSRPTSTDRFVHNHRSWFKGKTMWAYKFN